MRKKSFFLLVIVLLAVVISASAVAILNLPDNSFGDKLIFPKGESYKDAWEQVYAFENKGLPKSSLEQVEIIYNQAKQDTNYAQYVKALIHKLKYKLMVEEDATKKIILELRNEADSSQFPLKPVLHSMMAEMYWMYYQQNSYKFYNRTETVAYQPEDIATWDLKRIVDATVKNYLMSLENTDSLKRTQINLYDDILYTNQVGRKYRPTLYDFLAHRAVDFFRNTQPDISAPAKSFVIEGPEYFGDAESFVKLEISSPDTMALKYYALKILQDLLVFHQGDAEMQNLVDVDIKRLKLVKEHSVDLLKDTLYFNALKALETKCIKAPISTDVSYEIASVYFSRGSNYQPLQSDDNKWLKKTAYNYCQQAIDRFPKSQGAQNCRYLQYQITKKSMSFQLESYVPTGKPSKSLISYQNIDHLHYRLVKLDRRKHRDAVYRLYYEDFIKYAVDLKPLLSWEQEITDDGDHQSHSVEIKIPELDAGYYMILASHDKDFKITNNAIAYAYTTATNTSYIQRKNTKENYEFYAMDRETGKPLAGIEACMWKEVYNYKSDKYEYKKIKTYTTDANGYVFVDSPSDYRTFYMEFINGDDKLYTNESFYQYKPYDYSSERTVTHFFTDRAIYRPGQTVYFKGIILKTDGEKNEIRAGFSTTVYFYDANYQKVSSLSLTSNEYGTISGSFVTPQGVMNGQMRIDNSYGSAYFSVEEYKRPKFEVDFEPVKGSYKLNEKVKVTGTAKAYAGSNIDGAKVQYKVVRSTYYPYYRWYWGWYSPPTGAETVITHGTTETSETGEFEIEFTALPDLSVDKKWSPSFNYRITADVTDINGETHSSEQTVYVGYKAMVITTTMTDKLNTNTFKKFELRTSNLNGEAVPAKGTIQIYKLKENDKLFCKRKWTQADRNLFTKEEYYELFPYELYENENSLDKLEKEAKVFNQSFDISEPEKIVLTNADSWKQGRYLMEIKSTDEFGEEVEYKFYFIAYSPENKSAAVNSIDWFTPVKTLGEPGEEAEFLVGTMDKDVKVLYEIEHKGIITHKEWLTLSEEQKLIKIPIEEKHRGNFIAHFVFVKHNNLYSYDNVISVPYTNKQLDIEFATFRDKLNPGDEEEWKITIKGKNGDKVAAEMLATLYDASLDAFRANNWNFSIYPYYYGQLNWYSNQAFSLLNSTLFDNEWNPYVYNSTRGYDALNWFGFYFGYYYGYYDNFRYANGDTDEYAEEEMDMAMDDDAEASPMVAQKGVARSESKKEDMKEKSTEAPGESQQDGRNGKDRSKNGGEHSGEGAPVKARTNFNETAFFYPHLETNEKGEVIIKFTIPEALTRWKMLGFAHTKDLKFGLIDNELVTQKELMVMPNVPRFFRENDKITITSKITNISETDLSGSAQLMLFDAITMKPVDDLLKNKSATQSFTAKKGLSTNIKWELEIPEGIQALTYRVIAKAGKFSDGEENTIPVLTNRMLVTESMPLPVRSMETKEFKFEKLINSVDSKTLKHHKLTLEFTANPAWYAVQALPYLIEYPYECAEQVFSRFYANSIASHIANSDPKIRRVFDSWKNTPDSEALLSNLEKNQELKSLLLEETPWVLDAQDESVRKRRVGLLFDLNHMSNNLESAIRKLKKMQAPGGGWTWFKGMPVDRYITQHIITGFGHLDNMGVTSVESDSRIWSMVEGGVEYLDKQIRKDYEWILKYDKKNIDKNHLSYYSIQYLYARSYFMDRIKMKGKNKEAFEYYKKQAEEYWLSQSKYMQGMIALALNRFEVEKVPMEIMNSIKEHALVSDEMGMYWKDNNYGYYWYQAPIETHALLIEAFDEVAGDKKAVDDLRVWLLKQKQTQDWKTTKATTEAVYALLLRGTDWLATESAVEIQMADKIIDPAKMEDVKVEAGTGYFKKSWTASEIEPEMGNVKVTKRDEGVSWGALYWQYFEQLDKITPHETPLKLKKKLFVERMTDGGKTIEPLDKSKLIVGDKVIVRIELRVDRAMEYVHMKDMRAAGFEPINVISQYKYQDGLGYYESTRDVATNFFISYLNKGTYVFEYPLRVTHEGDFSNGITTIQCMYAPEFGSHSEGVRVNVEK